MQWKGQAWAASTCCVLEWSLAGTAVMSNTDSPKPPWLRKPVSAQERPVARKQCQPAPSRSSIPAQGTDATMNILIPATSHGQLEPQLCEPSWADAASSSPACPSGGPGSRFQEANKGLHAHLYIAGLFYAPAADQKIKGPEVTSLPRGLPSSYYP